MTCGTLTPKEKPLMPPTILCVTPNVAIDRTLLLSRLEQGQVQRVRDVLVQTGSKGVNVARALRTLGGTPLAMGLLGGHNGRQAAELVEAEGLAAVWTWFSGETRTCTIIVEDGGTVTVLNENGRISADAWVQLKTDVLAHLDGVSSVCISGSLPHGTPDSAPRDMVEAVQAAGVPVWVDLSGAPLRNAVAALPRGVKVNGAEIGALLDQPGEDVRSAAAAGRVLYERGIETVVVTLGALGAVLVDKDDAVYVPAPKIDAISDVGSGDSFLAAMALAYCSSQDAVTALRWGVAAGAANTLLPGAAQFTRNMFDELRMQIEQHPVERV
jgi:1-phosphofructokinase family hexose kinase